MLGDLHQLVLCSKRPTLLASSTSAAAAASICHTTIVVGVKTFQLELVCTYCPAIHSAVAVAIAESV